MCLFWDRVVTHFWKAYEISFLLVCKSPMYLFLVFVKISLDFWKFSEICEKCQKITFQSIIPYQSVHGEGHLQNATPSIWLYHVYPWSTHHLFRLILLSDFQGCQILAKRSPSGKYANVLRGFPSSYRFSVQIGHCWEKTCSFRYITQSLMQTSYLSKGTRNGSRSERASENEPGMLFCFGKKSSLSFRNSSSSCSFEENGWETNVLILINRTSSTLLSEPGYNGVVAIGLERYNDSSIILNLSRILGCVFQCSLFSLGKQFSIFYIVSSQSSFLQEPSFTASITAEAR